eukprot:363770-Chlamydomonas_euryale.AAC.1
MAARFEPAPLPPPPIPPGRIGATQPRNHRQRRAPQKGFGRRAARHDGDAARLVQWACEARMQPPRRDAHLLGLVVRRFGGWIKVWPYTPPLLLHARP